MKQKLIVIVVVVVIVGAVLGVGATRASRTPAPGGAAVQQPTYVAGAGKVEPVSESVQVGTEVSGKLDSVNVEEGTPVRRGDVLAVLENADYLARVKSAEAQVLSREAQLQRVLNGARRQERDEARAAVMQAEAVLENARAEMDRRQRLFAEGVISREEADRYAREFNVAKARFEQSVQRHKFVDAEARDDDRVHAEAELQIARAELEEARVLYQKTFIRSPLDGTVLRKHHRSGESVVTSMTVPDPIVTVGDQSRLRIRVEVDETDIGRLQLGKPAYVTADAFADRKFHGKVVQIGQQLGRKEVQTDKPTEKVDTKVLEVLVELEPGLELPVGLRVDSFIESASR